MQMNVVRCDRRSVKAGYQAHEQSTCQMIPLPLHRCLLLLPYLYAGTGCRSDLHKQGQPSCLSHESIYAAEMTENPLHLQSRHCTKVWPAEGCAANCICRDDHLAGTAAARAARPPTPFSSRQPLPLRRPRSTML